MSSEYISGVCNIGAGEIRRRQLVALVGLILSLLSLISIISTSASPSARLGIFAPLSIAAIGWVQSRKKFCLAYGFLGTFNFGKLGELSKVADAKSKSADRKTALTILGQALALSLALTAVVYLLPLN